MKNCSRCGRFKIESISICPKCDNEKLLEIIFKKYYEAHKIKFNPKEIYHFKEFISPSLKNIDEITNECVKLLNQMDSRVIGEEFVEYGVAIKKELQHEEKVIKEKENIGKFWINELKRKDDRIKQLIKKVKEKDVEIKELTEKSKEKEKSEKIKKDTDFNSYTELFQIIRNERTYFVKDEQIFEELSNIKNEHPEFSHLQALYYLSCDHNILFFEELNQLVAEYDGTCIKCQKEIYVGQSILSNPQTKAIQHIDCEESLESLKPLPTTRVPLDEIDNGDTFRRLINDCGKEIFIVDRYIDSKGMDWMIRHWPTPKQAPKLQKIRIMSDIDMLEDDNARDRYQVRKYVDAFNHRVKLLKKFLASGNSNCTIEIKCRNRDEDKHDRYVIGENRIFSLPGGIDKFWISKTNDMSNLWDVTNQKLDAVKRMLEESWKERSLDLQKDEKIIITILEDRFITSLKEYRDYQKNSDNRKEGFHYTCSDCGKGFDRDKVIRSKQKYCPKCFPNNK